MNGRLQSGEKASPSGPRTKNFVKRQGTRNRPPNIPRGKKAATMKVSWPRMLVFAVLAALLSPSAGFSLAIGAVKPFRSAIRPAVSRALRTNLLMVSEQQMCGTWSLQQVLHFLSNYHLSSRCRGVRMSHPSPQ